uniref:Related to Translin n=1 Tax=Melanopsichium pennsylvanicum 4 TaxID=1398559 RepID=A0A077QSC0_9BASI|nr:related to Translin [Melanopsichium pennsylvanicum 4]
MTSLDASSQGLVAAEFSPLFAQLEAERELCDSIREKSKELDRCYRALSSTLNGVHSTKGDQFDAIVESTKVIFAQAREKIRELSQLIPSDQYYRYDVKKIEEIVYDISLRGLVKGQDQGIDGLAFPLSQNKQQQLVHLLSHHPI